MPYNERAAQPPIPPPPSAAAASSSAGSAKPVALGLRSLRLGSVAIPQPDGRATPAIMPLHSLQQGLQIAMLDIGPPWETRFVRHQYTSTPAPGSGSFRGSQTSPLLRAIGARSRRRG
mmetsp:Transcript_19133/g.48613  ORF Transcript_19133/g.48613 Transcript_19133/m.48613 type:complete len:118 (-) Transcript_19133:91-444(-)